jgi:hypothetical protein
MHINGINPSVDNKLTARRFPTNLEKKCRDENRIFLLLAGHSTSFEIMFALADVF